ncbi:TIGR01777 family oxidoreductase [Rothia sp. ZJ932]|uniref:TIGR01777 family oxidoreductase n=1 Tax=Rothia sp. ZJ932 TaxID=2810516 RepID=UPI0019680E87|nr:TIGR01777 family oxidoreductase [Rothia sp. ZJ932]QRZ61520.1 TIGR01777 family oxidoreductase [Rothia sp. ZJ932]
MGSFKHTTVIARPVQEVIDWHLRPGALTRATPHWAGSVELDKGVEKGMQARLKVAVPATKGLMTRNWTALIIEVTDRSFTDTALEAPVAQWQHTHDFLETANQTVVRDSIEFTLTPKDAVKERAVAKNSGALEFAGNALTGIEAISDKVAERFFEKVFQARGARIEADLEFQERYADVAPQTIVIAGVSGMVGRQVSALLTTGGHTVRTLVRRAPQAEGEYRWDPDAGEIDESVFEGADAVIHLGGASINTRFTEKNKKKILESRVKSTALLARTLARLAGENKGPATLVVASAIGIYGADRAGEILSEDSTAGRDFLAEVCARWEQAADPAREAGLRVVHVRTGIVLTPLGGALRLQLPLFLTGTGGTVGKGENIQSWISLDDIAGIYVHSVLRENVEGAINAVAPEPVANKKLATIVGKVLKRPAVMRAPRLTSDALLGKEGTDQLVLADQNVSNDKLTGTGYVYFHDTLRRALESELG